MGRRCGRLILLDFAETDTKHQVKDPHSSDTLEAETGGDSSSEDDLKAHENNPLTSEIRHERIEQEGRRCCAYSALPREEASDAAASSDAGSGDENAAALN